MIEIITVIVMAKQQITWNERSLVTGDIVAYRPLHIDHK